MNRSGRTACKRRLETLLYRTFRIFFQGKFRESSVEAMYVLAERLLLRILENSSLREGRLKGGINPIFPAQILPQSHFPAYCFSKF